MKREQYRGFVSEGILAETNLVLGGIPGGQELTFNWLVETRSVRLSQSNTHVGLHV